MLSPLSCGTDTEQCCLASVAEHAGMESVLIHSGEEWKLGGCGEVLNDCFKKGHF